MKRKSLKMVKLFTKLYLQRVLRDAKRVKDKLLKSLLTYYIYVYIKRNEVSKKEVKTQLFDRPFFL